MALPVIGRDLHAGVAGLQWTLDGYVLTLAALVLAAGSLSDIYGRRRVFTLGTAVFVAAGLAVQRVHARRPVSPVISPSRTDTIREASAARAWSCVT